MKKKIISSILSLAMLLSLLPVGAFAAATAGTVNTTGDIATAGDTTVVLARMVDKGQTPTPSEQLNSEYKITAVSKDENTVNVTVSAKDVVKHSNGTSEGYWVGIGVPAPKATGEQLEIKQGFGTATEAGTLVDQKDGQDGKEWVVNKSLVYEEPSSEGSAEYWTYYFNASPANLTGENPVGYITVTESATTTTYKITFDVTHQDITNVKATVVANKESYNGAGTAVGRDSINTAEGLGTWDETRDASIVIADTDFPWVVFSFNRTKAGSITYILERKEGNNWTKLGELSATATTPSSTTAWGARPMASFTNADGVASTGFTDSYKNITAGTYRLGVQLDNEVPVYSENLTVADFSTKYTVTPLAVKNDDTPMGTVTATATDGKYYKGERVTVKLTPAEGYSVKTTGTLTYKFLGQQVEVKNGNVTKATAQDGTVTFSFTMPGANVDLVQLTDLFVEDMPAPAVVTEVQTAILNGGNDANHAGSNADSYTAEITDKAITLTATGLKKTTWGNPGSSGDEVTGGTTYVVGVALPQTADVTYAWGMGTKPASPEYKTVSRTQGAEDSKFVTFYFMQDNQAAWNTNKTGYISVRNEAGKTTDYTITFNVTLKTYDVNVATNLTNGTVTANPAKANDGATVTLTATPANGYVTNSVIVKNGETPIPVTLNADGTYTFAMPAADVSVTATFTKAATIEGDVKPEVASPAVSGVDTTDMGGDTKTLADAINSAIVNGAKNITFTDTVLEAAATEAVKNTKVAADDVDTAMTTISGLANTATNLKAIATAMEGAEEDTIPEAVTVVTQVYMDVAVTSVNVDNGVKEITFNITPTAQTVLTTQTNTANLTVYNGKTDASSNADTANAIKVGTPKPIAIAAPTKVTLPLPADFATTGTKLWVKHEKGSGNFFYQGKVEGTVLTFTSTNGFSPFTVYSDARGAGIVAQVGDNGYATVQEAINAVPNNGTVTLLTDTLPASDANLTIGGSTSKTVKFVLGDGVSPVTLKINGTDVEVKAGTTGGSYTYTPTSTGGGGGVSSNVTVDRPTNGKVSVTPTAPSKGATVTINLTPDTGYAVGTVTVTDKDGKAVELTKVNDNQYTFTMPDGKVTVKATFTQIETPSSTGFTDVAADAYYADAVKWAVEKGITNGLTATTFGPNNSCTRGQMVTFLWRAAGSPAATGTNSFSDVASSEYYYNAVLWAVEKGITNGTSATTFSPNATVNRGQTVTFLYRYAESPAATGTTSFTDVAADAFYADAVKWAVAEEITNGTSSTTFSPASNCTRGQIVTFMYRQMAE